MERTLLELMNPILLGPAGALVAWAGTRQATLLYAVLVVGWMLARPALRPLLLVVALSVGCSELSVTYVLKPLFDRARPCAESPELRTGPPGAPRRCGDDPAFPSGHAASTAAIAAASGVPTLMVISALVGVQRVVAAQHHPSDVAAGWIWGGALGALVRRLWQAGVRRRDVANLGGERADDRYPR